MRPVSIKLPKNLEALLDELARARGMSRSAVVREALKAYAAAAAAGPSAGSVIDSAGELVGSLDGPRDLSTAAKHVRGFGE
jgi:predicted transcriptional regulator